MWRIVVKKVSASVYQVRPTHIKLYHSSKITPVVVGENVNINIDKCRDYLLVHESFLWKPV